MTKHYNVLTFAFSPSSLVFGRDMIFNVSTIINWQTTLNDKQTQVDKDNLRENSRRTAHDYAVGEQVFVKIKGVKRKLDPPKKAHTL